MTEYCQTCRFFLQEYCYRYPPQIVAFGISVRTDWPKVQAYNWCGEHQISPARAAERNAKKEPKP